MVTIGPIPYECSIRDFNLRISNCVADNVGCFDLNNAAV